MKLDITESKRKKTIASSNNNGVGDSIECTNAIYYMLNGENAMPYDFNAILKITRTHENLKL